MKIRPVEEPQSKPELVVRQNRVRSVSGSSSGSGMSREDVEAPEILRRNSKKKSPVVFDRAQLTSRFKTAIVQTLSRRLALLGITGTAKFVDSKKILAQLETSLAGQTRQFLRTRRQFESQLDKRLVARQNPSASSSPFRKQKTMTKKDSASPKMTASPPVESRAPVPTPRSVKLLSHPSVFRPVPATLMARDGEATHQVETGNEERTTDVSAEKEAMESDDSFSLSSLDAILSELKKPNRYGSSPATKTATSSSLKGSGLSIPSSSSAPASSSPPLKRQGGPTKSVQWRVPVETMEKPLDQSWDS